MSLLTPKKATQACNFSDCPGRGCGCNAPALRASYRTIFYVSNSAETNLKPNCPHADPSVAVLCLHADASVAAGAADAPQAVRAPGEHRRVAAAVWCQLVDDMLQR